MRRPPCLKNAREGERSTRRDGGRHTLIRRVAHPLSGRAPATHHRQARWAEIDLGSAARNPPRSERTLIMSLSCCHDDRSQLETTSSWVPPTTRSSRKHYYAAIYRNYKKKKLSVKLENRTILITGGSS